MWERIPEPLIGLERSHDKWEGMREGMREGIPEPLIGSDRSHGLVSAPERIHSLSTNQMLRNPLPREMLKFLNFDTNSTSDMNQMC